MKGEYILGDCMEYLGGYADNHFDLAIVDPPYGIGVNKMQLGDGRFKKEGKNWDNNKPSSEYWDELFRISKNQIVFGANYFDLDLSNGIIFWYKRAYLKGVGQGEVAWNSFGGPIRVLDYTYVGNFAGFKNPKPDYKMKRIHPTQKPVAVYRWMLENYAKPGQLILDTHVGSASSLIACEMEGFNYVGFEKDSDYYQQSTKRIKQHLAQKVLF